MVRGVVRVAPVAPPHAAAARRARAVAVPVADTQHFVILTVYLNYYITYITLKTKGRKIKL